MTGRTSTVAASATEVSPVTRVPSTMTRTDSRLTSKRSSSADTAMGPGRSTSRLGLRSRTFTAQLWTANRSGRGFVADLERLARLQYVREDHLRLAMHGSSAQVTEQSQSTDHGPRGPPLDNATLPPVAQARSHSPLDEVHRRLISIQVDLLLPRLRPSTKASPTMTSTATMIA